MSPTGTLLVIPCYRDGERLAGFLPGLCAALEMGADDTVVQVVDDGSPLAQQQRLAGLISELRTRFTFPAPDREPRQPA